MKKYFVGIIIFVLLLTACAQQAAFNDADTTDPAIAAAVGLEDAGENGDLSEAGADSEANTGISSATEIESDVSDNGSDGDSNSDQNNDSDSSPSGESGSDIGTISDATAVPATPDIPVEIDYEAVRPNEIGNIMIIMYHGLSETNPGSYDRKTADFIIDLETMYSQGYRLVSVGDLIDGRIDIPAGCAPVVLTFDDGKSTAFSLVETDEGLVPQPGCAVDILNKFCEENPDFGKAAAFYVNGSKDAFPGAGTLAERFTYLVEQGYELGNHTYTHPELNKLDAQQIQDELGRMEQIIRENTGGYVPRSMAYPHGVRPKEELRPYALEGEFEGITYQYVWGIREGQSLISANPFHVVFDPLNVPRVRGTDDSTAKQEIQDLGYFLRLYEKNPERRYISDGNPDRISVPEAQAHLVNEAALGGRELFLY